jgi:hypothetical protein
MQRETGCKPFFRTQFNLTFEPVWFTYFTSFTGGVSLSETKSTYRDAGVDIDAGNAFVKMIKPLVKATSRPEVLADIGGFGGLFSLNASKYKNPVLVSGTDGVGTKLKLAFLADRHDTIGIDLVAMCVNDIVVQGAEPLFFLDYLATAKLNPEKAVQNCAGCHMPLQESQDFGANFFNATNQSARYIHNHLFVMNITARNYNHPNSTIKVILHIINNCVEN